MGGVTKIWYEVSLFYKVLAMSLKLKPFFYEKQYQ